MGNIIQRRKERSGSALRNGFHRRNLARNPVLESQNLSQFATRDGGLTSEAVGKLNHLVSPQEKAGPQKKLRRMNHDGKAARENPFITFDVARGELIPLADQRFEREELPLKVDLELSTPRLDTDRRALAVDIDFHRYGRNLDVSTLEATNAGRSTAMRKLSALVKKPNDVKWKRRFESGESWNEDPLTHTEEKNTEPFGMTIHAKEKLHHRFSISRLLIRGIPKKGRNVSSFASSLPNRTQMLIPQHLAGANMPQDRNMSPTGAPRVAATPKVTEMTKKQKLSFLHMSAPSSPRAKKVFKSLDRADQARFRLEAAVHPKQVVQGPVKISGKIVVVKEKNSNVEKNNLLESKRELLSEIISKKVKPTDYVLGMTTLNKETNAFSKRRIKKNEGVVHMAEYELETNQHHFPVRTRTLHRSLYN
eukprot:TRINITY_DN6776_c0_g1_i1.p1 TRINITY_DN6776_c0_g1~~TRINITY_DN6776_c0_g1_i1.p1  ORF type:complete len:422 (+),score=97.55 TRINITY_DN6776_c0_g1_i1:80-1345(+)